MQKFKSVFSTPELMDRVYVYLVKDGVNVCWWKGNVKDFTNKDPSNKWLIMKRDAAIGLVTNDYEAGMIQLKLSINPLVAGFFGSGPAKFERFDAWKKDPPRRLDSKKIRCFIFQCRDIPAADTDGNSDAFIEVWNQDGRRIRTKTIEDSLNPIFYETLEL